MSINLDSVTNIMLGNTPVEQIEDANGNVLWSAVAPDYFYIEDISGSDNTLSIVGTSASATAVTVYKSTDGRNWSTMGTTSTTAITATIPANGKLYLKASDNAWSNNNGFNQFSATGNHNAGGNIMSLLRGDNYENATFDNTNTAAFRASFNSDSKLKSCEHLGFPSNVTQDCYRSMFENTGLTTPPALPATTLETRCYRYMFARCSSLTTAPALPATTLADECYSSMFNNCSSLTTAPALPATTLANSCYNSMFYGCTSLTTPPALSATTLAADCCKHMFYNCTSLTAAPALPATTLTNSCYAYMFYNCTSLTAAPALSATTLVNNCYEVMFSGCSSLNTVTTYANDISASNCLNNWLSGVAATGDFYNLGTATYTSGDPSGIPSGWTEHSSL